MAPDDPCNGETLAIKMREAGFLGFIFSFSSADDMGDPEALKRRRIEAGMNGVLGKPFLVEQFKTLIAEYFASKTT